MRKRGSAQMSERSDTCGCHTASLLNEVVVPLRPQWAPVDGIAYLH